MPSETAAGRTAVKTKAAVRPTRADRLMLATRQHRPALYIGMVFGVLFTATSVVFDVMIWLWVEGREVAFLRYSFALGFAASAIHGLKRKPWAGPPTRWDRLFPAGYRHELDRLATAERTARLDRLLLAPRRYQPRQFAFLAFVMAYTVFGVTADVAGLFRVSLGGREARYWFPLALTLVAFWAAGQYAGPRRRGRRERPEIC